MFGDWYLAWGAYNGGPGRIRRAVKSAGTTDFWRIQEGPFLHPETDNYVPKIIAAAIIGHHPERYGFTNIEFLDPEPTERVPVDGSYEVAALARASGLDLETFQHLNPALRTTATPTGVTHINVPVGTRDTFVAAVTSLPTAPRVVAATHTVRRGETLSAIATRYRTTSSALARANGLRNVDRIYVGMRLRIPGTSVPVAEETPTTVAAATAPRESAPAPRAASAARPARPVTHTVARGDTLTEIATRYHVSVSDLKRWNSLSSDTIQLGRSLRVSGDAVASSGSGSGSGGSSARSSGGERIRYTVRSGDSLSAIASRHGVSMSDLQRWNSIRNPSAIQAGQVLTIYGASSGGSGGTWRTVTVASGDSLGRIASANGCTVDELRSWNGLTGSVIHPGQQLRIRR
jgi:membrane-bound lytic murein transglycosylase D